MLSAPFCCEPKTDLKMKVFKKRQGEVPDASYLRVVADSHQSGDGHVIRGLLLCTKVLNKSQLYFQPIMILVPFLLY